MIKVGLSNRSKSVVSAMRSILIDTNLFVLLVVGAYDTKLISKHKRTRSFTVEDYYLLVSILGKYKEIWITSHSMGEISNLLMQTDRDLSVELMKVFASLLLQARESHIPKDVLFRENIALRLGVADMGFIIKSKRVTAAITADLDLYLEVSQHKGVYAINWNHLRQAHLFS